MEEDNFNGFCFGDDDDEADDDVILGEVGGDKFKLGGLSDCDELSNIGEYCV